MMDIAVLIYIVLPTINTKNMPTNQILTCSSTEYQMSDFKIRCRSRTLRSVIRVTNVYKFGFIENCKLRRMK